MDQCSTPGYEFRGFRLDTTLQTLISPSGDPIPLPSRAYEVLKYLVERPGELVDKDSLMKAVWPRSIVEENNLSQCIFALRKVLGETRGERRFILTVPGRGFKFVAPVEVISNPLRDLQPADASALQRGAPAAAVEEQHVAATTGPARTKRIRPRWWLGASAAALCALLAAAVFMQPGSHPVTLPAEYEQLTDVTDSATAPALSPDGRMLAFIRGGEAFTSTGQIWLKVLPAGEPVQLTSGHYRIFAPAFTPDGARVSYTVVAPTQDGASWNTWTVPVTGGAPVLFLPNASGLSFIGAHEVMYSEFKTGLHLGIATSREDRSQHRDVYLPGHARAMAHYSFLSPDRRSVLIVEMNGAGEFGRCRLVPFAGGSAGHPVGPDGSCRSAAWAVDGRWMYFAVRVQGHSHLWRQRYPDGTPEQITFGPTEEDTVAPGGDGHSLLTAIGHVRDNLWLHDKTGERKLTTESYALLPYLSADGRRVYFLSAPTSSDPAELWRLDIASGRKEALVRGFDMRTYSISADERLAAFTARQAAQSEIWLASLDRASAPRLVVRGGDEAVFDRSGRLYFRSLGARANYLHRVAVDGSDDRRVLDSPIVSLFDVSPDGRWIAAALAPQNDFIDTRLVPVGSGKPRLIAKGWWPTHWSPDGHFLYVEDGISDQTLVVPADANGLPSIPVSAPQPPGAPIPHPADSLSAGTDPSTYVFVEAELRRNIYRVPLH